MSNNPIQTNYVSEIDQLLETFDKENPTLSASQNKERDKYLRVYFLRDNTNRPEETLPLWEGF